MTPLTGQLPHLFSQENNAHEYARMQQGLKDGQYYVKKGPNGYHVIKHPGAYQRPRRAK